MTKSRMFGALALLLVGVTTIPVASGEKAPPDGPSQLREIAITFVEAYETSRRFEEYSSRNRTSQVDIVTDSAAYDRIFGSTALDVHGAMVAELVEDARFRSTAFFRVYAAGMSPPHPVYVLGVKRNGTIIRLQGFPANDFNEMVNGEDARPGGNLLGVVEIYYRLLTPFRPSAILTPADLRLASAAIRKQNTKSTRPSAHEPSLFLPEVNAEAKSTLLRLCIFDERSTRLEVHRIRVAHDGPIDVIERKTVRDYYASGY